MYREQFLTMSLTMSCQIASGVSGIKSTSAMDAENWTCIVLCRIANENSLEQREYHAWSLHNYHGSLYRYIANLTLIRALNRSPFKDDLMQIPLVHIPNCLVAAVTLMLLPVEVNARMDLTLTALVHNAYAPAQLYAEMEDETKDKA
ncbi:hypothetical protein BC832DRAFT_567109 [Gaertneriomyces semiglobifer]|nr:hypothetical protein BC832DRAFT_567109 [Gaertneriomyces semiglobifer]